MEVWNALVFQVGQRHIIGQNKIVERLKVTRTTWSDFFIVNFENVLGSLFCVVFETLSDIYVRTFCESS